MKPSIAQKYRTQQIDLQPYGNTISVEAASDNPYDSDQDVEIFTQASGGMAGPGRSMRSRGTMIRRPQNRGHINGKVKTYRVRQDAAHNGFFPGVGELRARRSFMPGLGEIRARRSFMPGLGAGEVPLMLRPPAAAPAESSPWGAIANIFGTAATTTGSILSDRERAKLANAQAGQANADAAAERSRAERMDAEARLRGGTAANMGQHKTLVIGLSIAAAAAIGIALFLKRK